MALHREVAESDIVCALSEVPSMRLADIDEAFVLLDSGLGAVFSTTMARRAAMEREAYKEGASPRSLKNGKVRKLASGLSLSPALIAFRRAVHRIQAPLREIAAQKVTMQMVDNLNTATDASLGMAMTKMNSETPEMADMQRLPSVKRVPSLQVGRIPSFRENTSFTKRRRWSGWSQRSGSLSDFDDVDMMGTCSRRPSAAALQGLGDELGVEQDEEEEDDLELRAWCEETLRLAPEKLHGLERSASYRAKLGHQMLCWQALRTNKLSPSGVKAQLGGDGKGDGREPSKCHDPLSALASAEDTYRRWLRAGSSRKTQAMSQVVPSETPQDSTDHIIQTFAPSGLLRSVEFRQTPSLDSVSHHVATEDFGVVSGIGGSQSMQSLGSLAEFSLGMSSVTLRPLTRPPQHVEPHCSVLSTDVCSTPEFVYLRQCELAGLVPCQAAWRHFGGGIGAVDVCNRSLGDADIRVVVETAVRCAADGSAVRRLDLGGNKLTDAGLCTVSHLLAESAAACRELAALSLRDNASLRLRAPGVLDGFSKALATLPGLSQLDLSGVAINSQAANKLAKALSSCSLLSSLRMAGCGLGRVDQSDCAAIAALLGRREGGGPALEEADLSGNFFGRGGFAAVAEAVRCSSLKSLSFAGNAGGHWTVIGPAGASGAPSAVGGAAASPARRLKAKEEQPALFHPIQLLLESLQGNATLESLDLSGCGIGPDTAFVLEDALQGHPAIKRLFLMDNPLGDAGLRSVIRWILASSSSCISMCNVCGHRLADAFAGQVKFRHAQPSGVYTLDLRYPHERATLRMLLRRAEKVSSCSSHTFRFFRFDAKQPKPSLEKEGGSGVWLVPSHGVYSFTFQQPLSDASVKWMDVQYNGAKRRSDSPSQNSDATSVASPKVIKEKEPRRRSGEKKQPAAQLPRERSPWCSTVRCDIADSSPRWLVAEGLTSSDGGRSMNRQGSKSASQSRFSTGSSKDLPSLSPPSSPRTAAQAAAADPSCFAGLGLDGDWMEVTNLLTRERAHVSALRFPIVRSMFLALITAEEQLRFIRACSRDMRFNFAQVARLCEDRPELAPGIVRSLFSSIRGKSSQLMLLDKIKGDISSQISRVVSLALWFQEGNLTGQYCLDLTEPVDYAVAENCLLVNAWEAEVGKLVGRADVSQRGTYEMLRNEEHNEVPFTYTRGWTLPSGGWLRFDYSSIRRPVESAQAMPEASEVSRYLRSHAMRPESKLKALRAISVHMYLSTQQFRGMAQCFHAGKARQDFFCLMHTRVVDRHNLLGPNLLYNTHVFGVKDRKDLLRRVGHLHLLNPLHPEGVFYECHLLMYEQRMVLDFLVQLSIREPGGKVTNEKEGMHRIAAPASWGANGVPNEDVVFYCSYEPTAASLYWRQTLADKYCIWRTSSAERVALGASKQPVQDMQKSGLQSTSMS